MVIFASDRPSGNGWVAEVFSPGTLLCTTGLLDQPNTGWPVSALRIHTWPCLVVWTMAFIFLPSLVIVTGTGAAMVSMSRTFMAIILKAPFDLAGHGVERHGGNRPIYSVAGTPDTDQIRAAGIGGHIDGAGRFIQ